MRTRPRDSRIGWPVHFRSGGRRGRVLLWIILALILIPLILVALAPTLLSTGMGRSLIVSIAGDKLNGTLEIDDLSLGWFSGCSLTGVRIKDPQGREVLAVGDVSLPHGLWHWARTWEELGKVTVDKPSVGLYIGADGKSSLEHVLAEFFKPKPPEPPDPDIQKKVQALTGTIKVTGGTIRVVAADGREVLCENLAVTADLKTLADVKTTLSLAAAKLPVPAKAAAEGKPAIETGSGDVSASLTFSRKDVAQDMTVGGTLEAKVLGANGQPLPASPVKLDLKNVVLAADGSGVSWDSLGAKVGTLLTLTSGQMQARLGEAVTADGKADLQADIGGLSAWMAVLTGGKAPNLAGTLTWEGTASAKDAVLSVSGPVRITGFRAGKGDKVYREPGEIKIDYDIDYDPAKKALVVKKAEVDASMLKLSVPKATVTLGEQLSADAEVHLTANLKACALVLAEVTGQEEPIAVAGTLTYEATASTNGSVIHTEGKGGVPDLRVGKEDTSRQSGEQGKQVYEDSVTLNHDVTIDSDKANEVISFKLVQLIGKVLQAQAKGTVSKYSTTQDLNLAGSYAGRWEKLTILLHQFAPGLEGKFLLAGPLAKTFTIKGKASDPVVTTAIAGFGWTSGEAYGLDIGKADFTLTLKNGKIDLPVSPIPLSGGTANLGGTVDMTGKKPDPKAPKDPEKKVADIRYILPGETKLLDKVKINPRFGKLILSYLNPVFASVADLDGEITVDLKDINVPLSADILKTGHGSGHIDISTLRMRPAGMLGKLLDLGGIGMNSSQLVKFSGVDFDLKDGRLNYENFQMTFPGDFDLRFRGSIGLDDSVNLMCSLPVRGGFFTKLGVKGPVKEYVGALDESNVRIEIPIIGTRESPKLGKFDPKPIVEQAVKAVLKKKGQAITGDILKGVLPGAGGDGAAGGDLLKKLMGGGETPGGTTTPPAPKPGDILKGVLDGGKKPAEGPETKPAVPKPGDLLKDVLGGEKKPADGGEKKPADGGEKKPLPKPGDLLKGVLGGDKKPPAEKPAPAPPAPKPSEKPAPDAAPAKKPEEKKPAGGDLIKGLIDATKKE